MEVTEQNFMDEVLKSETPVLLDMWATWCQPCKALEPIIDQVDKEYTGKIKVGKIDIGTYSGIASRYGVVSAPTLMVFKNGQPVSMIVGVHSKQTIEAEINKHI